jgi:hypothetical protein
MQSLQIPVPISVLWTSPEVCKTFGVRFDLSRSHSMRGEIYCFAMDWIRYVDIGTVLTGLAQIF